MNASFNGLHPINTDFLSSQSLEGLPNADVLATAVTALKALSDRLKTIAGELADALKEVDGRISEMRATWDDRKKAIETTYEGVLRELQKSKIDGAEFIRLRQQIEDLRPLKERRDGQVADLLSAEIKRKQLLVEWEDIKASEYRSIEKAAKKVSRNLRDKVRVEVTMAGNREPRERLLKSEIGGNLNATFDRLREQEQLSLPDFAARAFFHRQES